MRIKIIATIFICFYSGLSFSQTKKLLHYFERHSEIFPNVHNVGCRGMDYTQSKEDYAISLFSDSTFVMSYSRTGNRFPEQHEVATGKFFKENDSMYLIGDSIIGKFFKSSPDEVSRLEEVFNIGVPLRIEYSNDGMSFYNSAGPFLIFKKASILNKYKNNNRAPAFSPVTYISPQFSGNQVSF
jgi:hypothetical protein